MNADPRTPDLDDIDRWEQDQYDNVVLDEWRDNARLEAESEEQDRLDLMNPPDADEPDLDAADPEVAQWEQQQFDDVVLDEWRDNARLEAEGEAEWDQQHLTSPLPADELVEDQGLARDPVDLEEGVSQQDYLNQSMLETLQQPNPEENTQDLEALLKQGANPNMVVEGEDIFQTHSPLHEAQTADHTRLLLEHGADVNAVDEQGRTALHMAQDPAQVGVLLDNGGDLSAIDHEGNTPLHTAQSPEVAQAMIDEGADVATLNNEGVRADEAPNVQELYGQIGAAEQQMNQTFSEVMSNLSAADAAQLHAEVPDYAKGMQAQVAAIAESIPKPTLPGMNL